MPNIDQKILSLVSDSGDTLTTQDSPSMDLQNLNLDDSISNYISMWTHLHDLKLQFGASQKRNRQWIKKLNAQYVIVLRFCFDSFANIDLSKFDLLDDDRCPVKFMRTAIFLDQQSRNERAVPTTCHISLEKSSKIFDKIQEIALHCANCSISSGPMKIFAAGAEQGLIVNDMIACLPWLSLVFRHAGDCRMSLRILETCERYLKDIARNANLDIIGTSVGFREWDLKSKSKVKSSKLAKSIKPEKLSEAEQSPPNDDLGSIPPKDELSSKRVTVSCPDNDEIYEYLDFFQNAMLQTVASFRRETLLKEARMRDEAFIARVLKGGSELKDVLHVTQPHTCDSSKAPPVRPINRCCLADDMSGNGVIELSNPDWKKMIKDRFESDFDAAFNRYQEYVANITRNVRPSSDENEKSKFVILSFSGGVDSTATLIILKALGIEVICFYIKHDNRDGEEMKAEIEWTEYICNAVGVKLYRFDMNLKRPHGVEKNNVDYSSALDSSQIPGLSREEYERSTKQIRLLLYQEVWRLERKKANDAKLTNPIATCTVILGHHLDDCDENRVEQMARGHVFGNLEGMTEILKVDDAPLILWRPFLHSKRKADFSWVLHTFKIPYMRDSTPLWSVRGRMRQIMSSIDAIEIEEKTKYDDKFMSCLDRFSRAVTKAWRDFETKFGISESESISSSRNTYSDTGSSTTSSSDNYDSVKSNDTSFTHINKACTPCNCELLFHSLIASKYRVLLSKRSSTTIDVLVLNLAYLLEWAEESSTVRNLRKHLTASGECNGNVDCENKDSLSSLRKIWNLHVGLIDTDDEFNIPQIEENLDYIFFERIIMSFVRNLLPAAAFEDGSDNSSKASHYHTCPRVLVTRKAVRHLWENMKATTTSVSGGGFSEELGYLHVKSTDTNTTDSDNYSNSMRNRFESLILYHTGPQNAAKLQLDKKTLLNRLSQVGAISNNLRFIFPRFQ